MFQAFLVEATQGVAPRTFYLSEFPQAALKQGGNRSSLPCFNPLSAVHAAYCTCEQLVTQRTTIPLCHLTPVRHPGPWQQAA